MGILEDLKDPRRGFQDFISPAYEDDEERIDKQVLPGEDHYDI